jgi:hypothetical protein
MNILESQLTINQTYKAKSIKIKRLAQKITM